MGSFLFLFSPGGCSPVSTFWLKHGYISLRRMTKRTNSGSEAGSRNPKRQKSASCNSDGGYSNIPSRAFLRNSGVSSADEEKFSGSASSRLKRKRAFAPPRSSSSTPKKKDTHGGKKMRKAEPAPSSTEAEDDEDDNDDRDDESQDSDAEDTPGECCQSNSDSDEAVVCEQCGKALLQGQKRFRIRTPPPRPLGSGPGVSLFPISICTCLRASTCLKVKLYLMLGNAPVLYK